MKFGWIPDYPDTRDYTRTTAEVATVLKAGKKTPAKVDLREYCSPIVDQGELGSCTANAASGIVEYFQKRAFGSSAPVSRMFIYKATRDLMKAKGEPPRPKGRGLMEGKGGARLAGLWAKPGLRNRGGS